MTPEAKRQAVTHLREVHGVSERRACQVLKVDRSTVRYQSVGGDDAELPTARLAEGTAWAVLLILLGLLTSSPSALAGGEWFPRPEQRLGSQERDR